MPGGEVHKTFKIFCGNLAGAATKDDLYYLFSRYGPVIEAVVMVGKFYGFVVSGVNSFKSHDCMHIYEELSSICMVVTSFYLLTGCIVSQSLYSVQ